MRSRTTVQSDLGDGACGNPNPFHSPPHSTSCAMSAHMLAVGSHNARPRPNRPQRRTCSGSRTPVLSPSPTTAPDCSAHPEGLAERGMSVARRSSVRPMLGWPVRSESGTANGDRPSPSRARAPRPPRRIHRFLAGLTLGVFMDSPIFKDSRRTLSRVARERPEPRLPLRCPLGGLRARGTSRTGCLWAACSSALRPVASSAPPLSA